MSKIICLRILAIFAGFAGPAAADVCRWVDEDGVYHYAATCPAGVTGIVVHTGPPPTVEQLESAIRRSEEMLSERQALNDLSEQKKTEKLRAGQAMLADRAANDNICEDAFRNREIPDWQLPVYFDDKSRLYYRDSLHHHWYAGTRIYLDDSDRQVESDRARQLIDDHCAGFAPSRPEYVARFREAPNIRETKDLLYYLGSPVAPPAGDVCQYANFLAGEMRQQSSGLKSDDEREFEALFNRNCR